MSHFTELRKQAKARRDKAISQAKEVYQVTLGRIATLEQDLLGRDAPGHRSMSSCLDSVIPSDRPFTTLDVLAAVEGRHPGRVWRMRTIIGHFHLLTKRGVIRRLRKARGDQGALYARVGLKVDPLPFENMTLVEVVQHVLGGRAMGPTDLAVALLEAGYETSMSPRNLRCAIGNVLKGDSRFRAQGGKWVVT